MTTVSAGSSASETLTGKSTITVALDSSERAIVSASRSGVEYSRSPVSNGETVGPFLTGDVVTIEALRGAVDYTVNAYSQLSAHMMTETEGDGLTAAQVDWVQSSVSGGWINQPNTLAVIGDSRLSSWRSVAATISERNPKGYLSWALAYSGERLTVISDQSVGGSQIIGAGSGTEISTTQINAAILSGAGHMILEGGVNDFFQAGATLAAVQAGYITILNAAIAAGMRVWIITTPTVNSAYGAYTVAAQGKLLALNDWLRTRVSSAYARKGVTVIDVAAKIVDAASATANAQTNFFYDNIHPRNLGAMVAGAEVARVWNLFIPEAPQLLSSNADNQTYSASSTNILDNGCMVAGATLATGFTSSLTGTGATTDSLVARSDGIGNDQQRVITFGANNDSVRMLTSDLKARVSDGDRLVMSCEVAMSAMTATRAIRAQLVLTGASSSLTASTMQLDATNDLAMTATTTHVLKTNPITVNLATLGALTSVQGTLAAFGSGAGGVTLKIGRWSIRKLPTA